MKRLRDREKVVKPWTILIYANGNNDLEPEITKSFLQVDEIGSGENLHIVYQIGRASSTLVKILRPSSFVSHDPIWNGVRRYYIKEDLNPTDSDYKHAVLYSFLGNINMADPFILQDFIEWGMKTFPAKRYMLILIGHGANFTGLLPDLTCYPPQIMTINDLQNAINKTIKTVRKKIDILLFDTCYMNSIEFIYELGIGKKSFKFLLIPQTSPLEGLPYCKIIQSLKQSEKKHKTKDIVLCLADSVNRVMKNRESKLVIFKLHSFALWLSKKLISQISYTIIFKNINIYDEECLQASFPFFNIHEFINLVGKRVRRIDLRVYLYFLKKVINMLLCRNKDLTYRSELLTIFYHSKVQFSIIDKYYNNLKFSYENYWTHLLTHRSLKYSFKRNRNKIDEKHSRILPLEGIINIIKSQNPHMSKKEIGIILDKLAWEKYEELDLES